MIKCFERSTVQRIEANPKVYVYGNANEYTQIRPWRNEEQKVDKREGTILRKDGSSAVINIALEKERRKKGGKIITTVAGDSNLVTHPSTNPAEKGLTSLSGRNMFLVV